MSSCKPSHWRNRFKRLLLFRRATSLLQSLAATHIPPIQQRSPNDGRHDKTTRKRIKSHHHSTQQQCIRRGSQARPHPQTGALLETGFVSLTSLYPDLFDLVLNFLDLVLVSTSFVVRNLRFELGDLLGVLPVVLKDARRGGKIVSHRWHCVLKKSIDQRKNQKVRRRRQAMTNEKNQTYLERVASSTTCFFPLPMIEIVLSTWRSSVDERVCLVELFKDCLPELLGIEIMRRVNANERKIVFSSSNAIPPLWNWFHRSILALRPFELDPLFLPPVIDWFICSAEPGQRSPINWRSKSSSASHQKLVPLLRNRRVVNL